jgi:hypothetical protein
VRPELSAAKKSGLVGRLAMKSKYTHHIPNPMVRPSAASTILIGQPLDADRPRHARPGAARGIGMRRR